MCEDDENEEDLEDGEKKSKVKKESKKPPAKQQTKSKLDIKVANEKNNNSLLNFFQKTTQQKRTHTLANGSTCIPDIVSHFMISRKLKICKQF